MDRLEGALAGGASDLLGWMEFGAVERGEIVVVALHRGALAGDCRHRYALARAEVGAAKTVARHQHHPADAGRGRGAARFGNPFTPNPPPSAPWAGPSHRPTGRRSRSRQYKWGKTPARRRGAAS